MILDYLEFNSKRKGRKKIILIKYGALQRWGWMEIMKFLSIIPFGS